ncbi:quinoprotein relay system zinc metallohydrolase 2 [Hansschlegelia quercus]|uniref:quinoprotein relay system zinc metallohydrolase 2 n=1 Tax=Hansschlegelia quercus TaxID=2528245 RepID=UPI00269AF02A
MRIVRSVRTGLVAVIAALIGGVSSAGAAEPLPVSEVAPGVFVYQAPYQLLAPGNQGAISNVGFIVGETAVAVIDAGNSRQSGERLLAAVRAKTRLPIRYVVNTHMHPDHTLGDIAFKAQGTQFVAHARFREALQARAPSYIEAAKRQMGDAFDESIGDIVLPDIDVKDRTTLDLGGRSIELEAEPKAHTDNDLTIFDKNTGTWFTGDLLFMGHVPAIDGSIEGWLAVMKRMASRGVARVVPGHGPASASWPDALAPQQRYLDRLRTDVKALIDQGADMREASEKAGISERDGWALFDDFNGRNAIEAYKELEWQ